MAYITNQATVALPRGEKAERGFWSRLLASMIEAREAQARRAISMYGDPTLAQKNSVEATRVQ